MGETGWKPVGVGAARILYIRVQHDRRYGNRRLRVSIDEAALFVGGRHA